MKRTAVWCAALLATAALSARGLTLLMLSEADIVKESDRIVLGTILTSQAQWLDPDGDGGQSIYTVATFRVDQSVKGGDQPGTLLTLHVFGGTIGNRTMTAPGLPLFKKDERLLLCLAKDLDTAKYTSIIGAVQGRWVVKTDTNGVDKARREIDGTTLFTKDADGNLVEANAPAAQQEEPLADVLSRLQKEVAK